MKTSNEIWVNTGQNLERLDLGEEVKLYPTFVANDRTSPSTIEAVYNPSFPVPATSKNARLLGHALSAQLVPSKPYRYLKALLTTDGVETLPNALLTVKGYSQGQYQLALESGNIFFLDALGDKKLSDLDLSAYDHDWTPATMAVTLDYGHWRDVGWGYELYERGKPIDFQAVDPYSLYPSVAAWLVLKQIVADAGFTCDDLRSEPLFDQLNVPSANPYEFTQDYRETRQLKAGFKHTGYWYRGDEFQELAPINYVGSKPYVAGALVDTSQGVNRYVVPTLGFYDLNVSLATYFGCNDRLFGQVSMKVLLRLNGAPLLNDDGSQVKGEERFRGYKNVTLTAAKKRVLLQPGDVIDVQVQGDKWPDGPIAPDSPQWYIGTRVVSFPGLPTVPFSGVEPACSFSVDLLPEFPPSGRVKLNEWLPDMKQLDFVKSCMLTLGLTIQADAYEPHLRLAPGTQLLYNIPKALNWSNKRDSYARPGRTSERDLNFRFGDYGRVNFLKWKEDKNVTAGYGDGSIAIADEVLPPEYELATLPFAATEASPVLPSLLRILNFDTDDTTATPVMYSSVKAEPRLTLREFLPELSGQLIMTPAVGDTPSVLTGFTTSLSYFDSAGLSLELNKDVLTTYWSDLRAMLDQSRYLTERYRLTSQDIAILDFSIPIWDSILGDYFAVSQVSEFDARRPTEVKLCRLNAAHLPPPMPPSAGLREWYPREFNPTEFY